jgi:rubrerythrin
MFVYNSLSEQAEVYMCKVCGHTFATAQSLSAHTDSEHPEAEQPEIF